MALGAHMRSCTGYSIAMRGEHDWYKCLGDIEFTSIEKYKPVYHYRRNDQWVASIRLLAFRQ